MRQISVGRLISLIAVISVGAFATAAEGAGHKRGTIDTIAGNGKTGLSGDGGPARKAKVNLPNGIATDREGNVYFVDLDHQRVRKVDPRGKITTFAGTGERGFSGDGGPARKARLNFPNAVATDRRGNVYIADSINYRVRKVDRHGTITTFAGNGEIANTFNPSSIGLEGPGVDARITAPRGLAVDGKGNVYVQGGWIVRRIDRRGIIHAFAGTRLGFAGDGGPAEDAQLGTMAQIAADKNGNVYLTDYTVHRVRKIDRNGTITTLAGTGKAGFSGDGGPARKAKLYNPQGVAVDGKGNVYIGDDANARVRKVDRRGRITTIVGNGSKSRRFGGDGGPAKKVPNLDPRSLAVDRNGNLLIADTGENRVRIVYRIAAPVSPAAALAPAAATDNKRGTLRALAGTGRRGFSGDGGPARKAKLNYPWAIARDPAGNIYFTAPHNHRVRKIDTHGKITTIAGTGKKGFSGDGGPARNARLHTPYGIAADQHGNVYIADYLNRRVRKVDPGGTITTFAGTGETPDIFDDLYHGDGGPATLAPINAPDQLATDQAGNLYIGGACTIRRVSPAGIISTVIGGELVTCGYAGDGGPAADAKVGVTDQMAVDSAGNLYVSDGQNKRIRKIAADGTISTFAGTGKGVFSGDHGPARKAKIYGPLAVAVDGKDNVFFSQAGPRSGSRIRKVDRNGIITTVAGNGKLGPLARPGQRAKRIAYWAPHAMLVDPDGNLLIAGYSDQRVWSLLKIAAPFP